jgi:hypothetical protein
MKETLNIHTNKQKKTKFASVDYNIKIEKNLKESDIQSEKSEMQEDFTEYGIISFYGLHYEKAYKKLNFKKNLLAKKNLNSDTKFRKSPKKIEKINPPKKNSSLIFSQDELLPLIKDSKNIVNQLNDKMQEKNKKQILSRQSSIATYSSQPSRNSSAHKNKHTSSSSLIWMNSKSKSSLFSMSPFKLTEIGSKLQKNQSTENLLQKKKIKNIIDDVHTKAIMSKIERDMSTDKFIKEINKLQRSVTNQKKSSAIIFDHHKQDSDLLRRKYVYLMKNKFM